MLKVGQRDQMVTEGIRERLAGLACTARRETLVPLEILATLALLVTKE